MLEVEDAFYDRPGEALCLLLYGSCLLVRVSVIRACTHSL